MKNLKSILVAASLLFLLPEDAYFAKKSMSSDDSGRGGRSSKAGRGRKASRSHRGGRGKHGGRWHGKKGMWLDDLSQAASAGKFDEVLKSIKMKREWIAKTREHLQSKETFLNDLEVAANKNDSKKAISLIDAYKKSSKKHEKRSKGRSKTEDTSMSSEDEGSEDSYSTESDE